MGEIISVSRPSIYNYFHTKEEIIIKNEKINTENFSKLIAQLIENREKILKLLSKNMYDIKEKSRLEKLIEFKEIFAKSMETMKKCLDKFFKQMLEEEKTDFLYSFLWYLSVYESHGKIKRSYENSRFSLSLYQYL